MIPHVFYVTIQRFSTAFLRSAIQNIGLPVALLVFVTEEEKNESLGVLLGTAGLLNLFAFLLVGQLSDTLHSPWGRRRPFIVLGTALTLVFLLGMASASSYFLFAASFVLVIFSTGVIDCAHIALLPDVVPRQNRGVASSYLAFFQTTGAAVGSVVAGLLLVKGGNSFGPLAVVLALLLLTSTATTCVKVSEPSSVGKRDSGSLLAGFLSFGGQGLHRFFRFLVFRFFIMFSNSAIAAFLLYFVRDYLRIADYILHTSLVFAASAMGSLVGIIVSAYVLDRYSKKIPLIASGFLLFLSLVLFAALGRQSFAMVYAAIVLYGVGAGAFFASATSLATLLIPEQEKAGKYMGVVTITTILAQLMAPLCCGFLLDGLETLFPGAGYLGMMLILAAGFLVGTIGLMRTEGLQSL